MVRWKVKEFYNGNEIRRGPGYDWSLKNQECTFYLYPITTVIAQISLHKYTKTVKEYIKAAHIYKRFHNHPMI